MLNLLRQLQIQMNRLELRIRLQTRLSQFPSNTTGHCVYKSQVYAFDHYIFPGRFTVLYLFPGGALASFAFMT